MTKQEAYALGRVYGSVQPLPIQSSWTVGFYSGVDSAYKTRN